MTRLGHASVERGLARNDVALISAGQERGLMKLTVIMPDVGECSAVDCAYNLESRCHAQAITVGDGAHPACDTYLSSARHANPTRHVAGVGACKVVACSHNRHFACSAQSIRVGKHKDHADCLTFATS